MTGTHTETKNSPSQKRRRRAERNAVRCAAHNTAALKASFSFLPPAESNLTIGVGLNTLEVQVANLDVKLSSVLSILESWCTELACERRDALLEELLDPSTTSSHAQHGQSCTKLDPHAEPFQPINLSGSWQALHAPLGVIDLLAADAKTAPVLPSMSVERCEMKETRAAESLVTPPTPCFLGTLSATSQKAFQNLVNIVAFNPSRRVREFLLVDLPSPPGIFVPSELDLTLEAVLQANLDLADIDGVGNSLADLQRNRSFIESHIALSASKLLMSSARVSQCQGDTVPNSHEDPDPNSERRTTSTVVQLVSRASSDDGDELQRGCAFGGLDFTSMQLVGQARLRKASNNECLEFRGHLTSNDQAVARRVASRLRQIQIGKERPEYKQYIQQVPVAQRRPSQPCTPDPESNSSKREFDRALAKWRRQLHEHEAAANIPKHRAIRISLETWLS